MITVTENAKKALKKILLTKVDNYYAYLRLTARETGGLGIGIDIEQPGDETVEYEGTKLLLVERRLAAKLGGVTLDTDDTPDGPELVFAGVVMSG